MRVDFIFTTFPNLSETFYQREIRALLAHGVQLNLYSLWGGGGRFDDEQIKCFRKWTLISLIWWLPYWSIRKPDVIGRVFQKLFASQPPSVINLLENLLGLGFALTHAHSFRLNPDEKAMTHAAWATAPGTASQLIGELTDRPFTLGAHAYDVFRSGGDWWLEDKLRNATIVITSSDATAKVLFERGATLQKLKVVRRGLEAFPPMKPMRANRQPLRLLSVGRLIEKKGYVHQLELYARCKRAGLIFEAKVVGNGPLAGTLRAQLVDADLHDCVELLGELEQRETQDWYAWADVFVYTGVVAASGDQDGLPNVVPEAMRAGIPVVSTAVAGVPEAIENEVSGRLLGLDDTVQWVEELQRLAHDDEYYQRIRNHARQWVEREFDAGVNAAQLHAAWREALF